MKNEQFEKNAKGKMIKNGFRSIMQNNKKCCVDNHIIITQIIFINKTSAIK